MIVFVKDWYVGLKVEDLVSVIVSLADFERVCEMVFVGVGGRVKLEVRVTV